MQDIQRYNPQYLNLDRSRRLISATESFHLLNNKISDDGDGGESVPFLANYEACGMEMPEGENKSAGSYYSPQTGETYFWVFNSNGAHFVYRINSNGECQVVYDGDCLFLSDKPERKITQFRASLKVENGCDDTPNGVRKHLLWIDGSDNPIGYLDVETSIVTDSFRTDFFSKCEDKCAYTQLYAPKPPYCPVGEWIDDGRLTNQMIGKSFKFMYRYVYYDGRRSEWSDRSTLYYQKDGSAIGGTGLKFGLDIGNPMVTEIELAYSPNNGLDWFIVEVIQKYKKYDTLRYWYEREIREDLVVNGCILEYQFFNDRLSVQLSDTESTRMINPMPQSPQCLFPVNDSVAFANYEKGVCPLDISEIQKFKVSTECSISETCKQEYVTLTIRAVVHNIAEQKNSYVCEREDSGVKYNTFSWLSGLGNSASRMVAAKQYFDGEYGFKVYIEGTNYDAKMEQWYYQSGGATSDAKKVDVRKQTDIEHPLLGFWGFHYQECKIQVPKGMKGFLRMASHRDEDDRNKSTQVVGTIKHNLNGQKYNSLKINSLIGETSSKEIYFDTCNAMGDMVLEDVFIIEDLLVRNTADRAVQPSCGYVSDETGSPVEGVRVTYTDFGGTRSTRTDFNGYFCLGSVLHYPIFETSVNVKIFAEQDCATGFKEVGSYSVSIERKPTLLIHDEIISKNDFANRFYADVKLTVRDCANSPVRNVSVAISGAKARVTDRNGVAVFRVRNYADRARTVTAVLMNNDGDFQYDCSDNCNPCMPHKVMQLPSCFTTALPLPQKGVDVDLGYVVVNRKYDYSKDEGLKHGGRYPFGIVLEYGNGQISSVYNVGYVDVPKIQEIGSFDFCQLKYDANGITLPDGVKNVKIVRGENIYDYRLQWVVDKKELLPNGNVKITYQSLNDYNKDRNFQTNVKYEFVQGDRIEFILAANGEPFDVSNLDVLNEEILSPFKSGDDVDFFNQLVIRGGEYYEYIDKGVMFEIQRAYTFNEKAPYFSICATIPVISNKLVAEQGKFHSVDTFLVKRNIAGFAPKKFEHKYPTDTWVGNANDNGDVYFENKYENKIRYGRNVKVNSRNVFNYFDSAEKVFNFPEQNGIVAVNLKDGRFGLCICESGEFSFTVSDNMLRVGQSGGVLAAQPDQFISDGDVSGNGGFGCSYEDIGSIVFTNEVASWFSMRAKHHIINDYRKSALGGVTKDESGVNTTCSRWFRDIGLRKKNGKLNVVSGYDNNGRIFITVDGMYSNYPPTIVYSIKHGRYVGFASFAPEFYSKLELNGYDGCDFIAMKNAVAYIHPLEGDKYNEFFGQAYDWEVGFVINKPHDKKKIPISIELQSDDMFYAKSVETDSELVSEIPPIKVVGLQKNKWNAPFLRAKNSDGGLYVGKILEGYEISVLLIRDNTLNLVYNSIDNNKQTAYGRLGYIISKAQFSEQSGFMKTQ